MCFFFKTLEKKVKFWTHFKTNLRYMVWRLLFFRPKFQNFILKLVNGRLELLNLIIVHGLWCTRSFHGFCKSNHRFNGLGVSQITKFHFLLLQSRLNSISVKILQGLYFSVIIITLQMKYIFIITVNCATCHIINFTHLLTIKVIEINNSLTRWPLKTIRLLSDFYFWEYNNIPQQ